MDIVNNKDIIPDFITDRFTPKVEETSVLKSILYIIGAAIIIGGLSYAVYNLFGTSEPVANANDIQLNNINNNQNTGKLITFLGATWSGVKYASSFINPFSYYYDGLHDLAKND